MSLCLFLCHKWLQIVVVYGSFLLFRITMSLPKLILTCNPLGPRLLIESAKTTSTENVSTEVLDKNKEHYLRCTDKAKKSIWYIKIYNCIYQNAKNVDLQFIMSNL